MLSFVQFCVFVIWRHSFNDVMKPSSSYIYLISNYQIVKLSNYQIELNDSVYTHLTHQ